MDNDAGMVEHISCPLCSGFLIDTITLTMCSHFFCRACLLRYLQKDRKCPTCKEELHDLKTAFYPDHTLQDFVYKYAPSTYWKEIRQRADFIEKRFPTTEEKNLIADWNLTQFSKYLCLKDEKISLCVKYISPKDLLDNSLTGSLPEEDKPLFKRYFRCPAQVKISHFKTILKGKFDLPDNYVLHFIDLNSEEVIEDNYTLQDLIYIFGWQRDGPLKLWFTLSQIITDEDQPPVLEVEMNLANNEIKNNNDDIPPPLPSENHDKMPSLTVNLSSELFKPDPGSSLLMNPRIPIITKTMEPPKKRRKTTKKKEKIIPKLIPTTELVMNEKINNNEKNNIDLNVESKSKIHENSNNVNENTNEQIKKTPSPINSTNTTTTPSSTSQSPKLLNAFDSLRKITMTPPETSRSSSTSSLPIQTITAKLNNSLTSSTTKNKSTSEPVTPVVSDANNCILSNNNTSDQTIKAFLDNSSKVFKNLIPNLNDSSKFVVPSKFISASSLAS